MALTKKYLKSKPVCKVTFKVDKDLINQAETVAIAGAFNNWNTKADLLTPLKDGSFKTTIDLEIGQDYEYRFVVDGKKWINDESADAYVPSNVGPEPNCVVKV